MVELCGRREFCDDDPLTRIIKQAGEQKPGLAGARISAG
jgi:hypothetical protein